MLSTDNNWSPTWWQRICRRAGSLAPVSWISARSMHHLDRLFSAATNGRHTAANLFLRLPVVTLTTVGAKSGIERSVPLVGIPDGDEIILIASNWGQDHHPGWYHNLNANPRARLAFGQSEQEYNARGATGAEYDRCWEKAVSIYGGYDAYKKRARGRAIPIMVLTPVTASG